MIKGESHREMTNYQNKSLEKSSHRVKPTGRGAWMKRGRMIKQRSTRDLKKLQGKVPWARIQKPVVSYTSVMSKALGSWLLYTRTEIWKPNSSECVCVSERSLTLKAFVRLQGCAAETEYRSQGFQWQQLVSQGMRSESTLETCPPLTCLHTGDAGGVKQPLPLSRTQRNLVCQQVYLTQRPKQQLGKTVEQRYWTWMCHTEKHMHPSL